MMAVESVSGRTSRGALSTAEIKRRIEQMYADSGDALVPPPTAA